MLVLSGVFGQHDVEDGVIAQIDEGGDGEVKGDHANPVFGGNHLDVPTDVNHRFIGQEVRFNHGVC